MIAYVLTGHGGPEKLEYREAFPRPVAGPGEVLVRVRACGCNNTDINTRIGWYSKAVTAGTTETQGGADVEADGSWGGHLTFPRVQGADICGEVAEVGDGVEEALVGKRVLVDTWVRDPAEPTNMRKMRFVGSELDGGFAQFAKVPRRQIHVVDSEQLTDAELATFATAYTTAENMLNRAKVTAGDVVLIPGASGGVGSALIQLANRRKATTVAMCSESKRAAVEAVGPTAVLPREPADVAAALKAAVGRDTVDVLADVVGGPAWPKLLDVVERGGRFTCAGPVGSVVCVV